MHYLTHTFRLWGLITRPLAHNPLYARTVTADHDDFNPFKASTLRTLFQSLRLLAVGVFFILLMFACSPGAFLYVVVILLFATLALYMFTGTGSGTLWTFSISGALARAARTGMTDLLTLSPIESPRWIIAVGILHRSPIFRSIFDQVNTFSLRVNPRLILIGAVLVGLALLTDTGREYLSSGVIIACVLLALYVDQVQSCLVALLMSLWFSEHTAIETDIRTFALLGFLTVQLGTYITTAFIVLWLFPQVGLSIGWGYGIPQLATLYLAREWVIALLWRAVPPYNPPEVPADADAAPVESPGTPE